MLFILVRKVHFMFAHTKLQKVHLFQPCSVRRRYCNGRPSRRIHGVHKVRIKPESQQHLSFAHHFRFVKQLHFDITGQRHTLRQLNDQLADRIQRMLEIGQLGGVQACLFCVRQKRDAQMDARRVHAEMRCR